jgi:hypothetical protein
MASSWIERGTDKFWALHESGAFNSPLWVASRYKRPLKPLFCFSPQSGRNLEAQFMRA